MEKIKKNFGFGCMRLPMVGEEVDLAQTCQMVDLFLEKGFNYFDTAHGYIQGKSETALKACLTSRYPREAYVLTNKLSNNHFSKTEDIRPLFESQLEACGVDYFDFYLMHAQNETVYAKYQALHAYEEAMKLKEEGKFRHFGISFHSTPEVLEQILTDHPEVEVVQIQLNYTDFEDSSVQSRRCLEVCRKFGKPVIVMEPVKGGSLVNLPEAAQKIFDALGGGSNASYAIRFAASQEGVMMVLSGMGNMAMMTDNVSYMEHFQPLTQQEASAICQVRDIFQSLGTIPCTGCRYCTEVCPQGINIPALFSCLNNQKIFETWNTSFYYEMHTKRGGKASDCLECGQCEAICPQHLNIRELLKDVAREFEKA